MEGDEHDRALLNLALLIESSPHLTAWQSLPLPAVISNLLLRNWTISALHNKTSETITYASVEAIQDALAKAPGDDIRTTGATVAYVVLAVFATVVVWLRTYSRRWILKKKNFKREDWIIWVSLILAYGFAGVMLYGDYEVAFGSRVYLISWKIFKQSLFISHLSTLIYYLTITVSRLAILFVFLTFSTDIRYRLGCYTVGFFNVTLFIVRVCFQVLQCHPVDFWSDPLNEACVGHENIYEIVLGVLSVVINAALLFLPTTIMHGLKLPPRDKYMSLVIFFFGFAATAASIIRILATVWLANSADKTFHQPTVGIWSDVEVCLSIVCACSPSLRALLMSRLDRNFGRRSTWSRRPPPVLTGSGVHPHRAYSHREIVTQHYGDGEKVVAGSDVRRMDSRTTKRTDYTEATEITGTTFSPRSGPYSLHSLYSPHSPASAGGGSLASPRIHVHGPGGEAVAVDADGNDNRRINTASTSSSSNTGSNASLGTGLGMPAYGYASSTYSRGTVTTQRDSSASTARVTISNSRHQSAQSYSRGGKMWDGSGGWGSMQPGEGRRPMDENRVTVSADTIAQMIEEEEEEERIRSSGGESEEPKADFSGRSWLHV